MKGSKNKCRCQSQLHHVLVRMDPLTVHRTHSHGFLETGLEPPCPHTLPIPHTLMSRDPLLVRVTSVSSSRPYRPNQRAVTGEGTEWQEARRFSWYTRTSPGVGKVWESVRVKVRAEGHYGRRHGMAGRKALLVVHTRLAWYGKV